MAVCGLLLTTTSCRKPKVPSPKELLPPPVVANELHKNGIVALPGAVYQTQAESPIHWQPWTKNTLERAKNARRLLFVVVAMPQVPGFQSALAELGRNPAVVGVINDKYVPVLIDGDTSREMGLLTAELCVEIKCPLNSPMFLWITGDANPVAWMPVPESGGASIVNLFNQADSKISQLWEDSMDYVLNNSSMDNANRRQRIEKLKEAKVSSDQPAVDVIRSVRQLSSLYDAFTRSFDESGGLFPSSVLTLLSSAAIHQGIPQDVRKHSLETVKELMKDLQNSAMFDPLDGGVYLCRRGAFWALPTFVRDCPGQARAAQSLIAAYRATSDPRTLEKALDAISFAEKSFGTPEGLFSVGVTPEIVSEKWMWSMEDIKKDLSPEDADWWIKATGMKGLGNIPPEADPRRQYFRCNTLGMTMTVSEIAKQLSQPEDIFRKRFEAVRTKLLEVRNARMGKVVRDSCSHAGATFRMVSLYAEAFAATGEEKYREKAVTLLKRAREAFMVGPALRMFSKDAPVSIGGGRAFLYALAMQSALDVAAITFDDQWLLWAEDLATTSAEKFTGNGILKECPDDARIVDVPISDPAMIFDDSTAGLFSLVETRLAVVGRPLVASFSALAVPLPTYVIERPILHTDLLLATMFRHNRTSLVMAADVSPELKLAVERLPVQGFPRRLARAGDDVPPGSVKIQFNEGAGRIVSTPSSLQEAVLPLPEN